ncbi:MAG: NAD kinase [Rhizobiaceae bacterium]|jgi:NAD+ kinase|nr:NAD kinase [Rhizobiaceae bacterium]
MKLAFVSADTSSARDAARLLEARYGAVPADDADVLVALGGDGHMLQMLHGALKSGVPIYGMNRGSVGFMMNAFRVEGLPERIAAATSETIRPLEMSAVSMDGKAYTAMAFNEVSLLRQSYQAAKLRVTIDRKVRLSELVCDGVMVATPVGSTAYNLSAHGPILPVDAPLLALTPVSPFRPRRWSGALLPNKSRVVFEALEPEKRPVNAVADHNEVKSVLRVDIVQRQEFSARILFDESHSWEERILNEQFRH